MSFSILALSLHILDKHKLEIKMKTIKKLLLALITFSALFITGCDDDPVKVRFFDAPHDVYTVTGDNRVNVYWSHVSPATVDYYRVYWSEDDNKFNYLGDAVTNNFIDTGAKNGVKTYYAVTAVAFDGYESELSKESAYSTPREEGFDALVHDYRVYADQGEYGGYSFLDRFEVNYLSTAADFFFDYDPEAKLFYISVWAPYSLADMGNTEDIHQVKEAPELSDNVWNKYPFQLGEYDIFSEEVKVGHTYVIHIYNSDPNATADNYAKIRIKSVGNDKLVFDWAYQDVLGVWELEKRSGGTTLRKIDKAAKRIEK